MAGVEQKRAARSESVPVRQAKRREPFDAALLCSKLEAHLRELDAARVRREKRDAVRNGHYVPRVAAKAFAATTSTMDDALNLARPPKRASEPSQASEEPPKATEKVYIAPMQQYATLNFQWPESQIETSAKDQTSLGNKSERSRGDVAPDEIAFLTETFSTMALRPTRHDEAIASIREDRRSCRFERRDSIELERRRQSIKADQRDSPTEESKHDSMNPTSSEGVPLCTSQEASPSRRHICSSYAAPRKSSIPTVVLPDRGRGQYRPGDAAKRRSNDLQRPHTTEAYHTLAERRASRFVESDAFLDDPIAEERDQRPKLVHHDRPNWAQQSQTGEDTHLSLRFLSRTSKKNAEERNTFPRPKSVMQMGPLGGKKQRSRMNSLPEEGTLIAEAVRKIEKEKKAERRKSIFKLTGLFKKS